MAKGLDVGTMNIVCAEKKGEVVSFTKQRNAFLELEASDLTKNMLETAKVLYVEKDDKIYILGEDAFKFANVFRRPVRRPMKHGIISPEEKESIPIIRLILQRLLGNSNNKEVLYVSSPANPVDLNVNVLYHKKTIEALTRKFGYETYVIDEGLAAVYSELGKYDFTGVGVSVGAGLTNVTVAYLATPVISFSIARGGDWIDEQVSIATGVPKERVTAIKESSFSLDSEYELGSVEGALSIYYDALITYIIQNLKRKLSEVTPPEAEFPVAIVGGSTKPKGFIELFEKRLIEANLPIDITKIQIARDPLYSVARGCLVAALTKEKEGENLSEGEQ
ncbi:conserved hypothetical protein [Ferroglobus placidus DSM 10642]|uniref:Cell division protein FtsA n=1 Tax=Ferroglobus placidus (strain DSM 10642 / AEDII12DO) TaxID=589924 RepID=D3RZE8_FERPA|nr:rod shape-determining protein [Ferroglobus placidus]ADC65861.1 conserved hypothetical protein [Ferroglobus placidus DSM 10642]